MSRHASAEDLARLDLDALRPRKATKVRAHMAGCAQCTQLNSQLSAVPVTLASVSYPAMPEHLSARLDTALAGESAQRVASAPAAEAGRRDLPERSRHARHGRGGWRMPGMSVFATRIVTATGALVIVGVGGYEIASHTGHDQLSGTAASSSGAAAAPNAQVGQMSLGPSVRYGEPSAAKMITTVRAETNFTSATLRTQAIAAVHAARVRGAYGTKAATGPVPTASSGSAHSTATSAGVPNASQLSGCLDGIAGNQQVLLMEMAKFEGKPAMIIVTAQTATQEAEVWVVAPACSASHPDVLDHLRLSRT
jgi:anti-sigma factor ChrR (cupin superfamily)